MSEERLPQPYIVEVYVRAYLRFRVHAVDPEDALTLVREGEGQNPEVDHWDPITPEHVEQIGRAEEFEE